MSLRNTLIARFLTARTARIARLLTTSFFSVGLLFVIAVQLLTDADEYLIAYYSFNASSGAQVSDETGQGNNGTLINGASLSDGLFGKAVQFSGNGDYINVPSAPGLNPENITLSAWINPSLIGDEHHYIVSKHRDCCDSPGQGGYGLRINRSSGSLRGEIWLNSSSTLLSVNSTTSIPADIWTHVAMVFDGSNIHLYVNGVLDSTSITVDADTIQSTTKDLTIGMLSYLAPKYYGFTGFIDDLRIYSYGLSDAEIAKLYSANPTLGFYESFDSYAEMDANGAVYSGVTLDSGIAGNAALLSPGATLNYPAVGSIYANKGTISFWFKPEWPGDDTSTHFLFDWRGSDARFRVFKFYSTSSGKNYFVFRIDHVDGSQREVSTSTDEPDATMQWQAGEWHEIEVFWDFTAQQQYIGLVLDHNLAKIYQNTWQLGTLPETFSIGSDASSNYSADGAFDELYIYRESLHDPSDPIGSYLLHTQNDGIWQPHETIHNSPQDAPVLDATTQPGEDYFFYQTNPFEAVYEGTVPVVDAIGNVFSYRVAQNEYEPLFFNVYSRETLSGLQVDFTDFISTNGTIPKSSAQIRVVKNWFQAGSESQKTVLPVYTPELLVSDDRITLQGLPWSYNQLPSLPVLPQVHTDVASGTSKQFVVILHVPDGTTPGIYTSTVTFMPENLPNKTLTLNVEVLPFSLQAAEKDYVIYHRARVDNPASSDYTDLALYQLQVEDIAAHGFNGVTLYGLDNGWQEDKLALAKAAGISDVAIFMTEFDPDLKVLMEQYGYEPYFYGHDEPNTLDKMINYHLPKSIDIHAGGAKVVTAIKKSWADRLKDPTDDIYSYFPVGTYEPLDFINLCRDEDGLQYFHNLIDGLATSQERETYYWQIMVEDPRVNRFMAGFFLWNTGLNGVFPYAYQDVRYNNPYDDFDDWTENNTTYRDHLATYPGQEGPVPTMQWEALREGIDDVRYLETWKNLHNQVAAHDPVKAQASGQVVADALAKYNRYAQRLELSASDFSADRKIIIDEILLLKDYLQDADGDGYINSVDCDDLNSSIYPGALEISYDQIDQNCDGTDATIVVTQAAYNPTNKKLTIYATSELNQLANLVVENYGEMLWLSKKGYWSFKERIKGGSPETVIITGVEGSIQAIVQ